jgi:hypothetical protein
MFRFTIRELILLTVIVATGAAWCVDHRNMNSLTDKFRAENYKLAVRLIPLESFPQGIKRINDILDAALKSPPPPEVAAEICHYVRDDPDFRIRVRAMAVCPYLNERAEAISVLVDALRERRSEQSAEGVVPTYAARYLADMKAVGAIAEVKSWLNFLKEKAPYQPEQRSILIMGAEKRLAQLLADAEAEGANSPKQLP